MSRPAQSSGTRSPHTCGPAAGVTTTTGRITFLCDSSLSHRRSGTVFRAFIYPVHYLGGLYRAYLDSPGRPLSSPLRRTANPRTVAASPAAHHLHLASNSRSALPISPCVWSRDCVDGLPVLHPASAHPSSAGHWGRTFWPGSTPYCGR